MTSPNLLDKAFAQAPDAQTRFKLIDTLMQATDFGQDQVKTDHFLVLANKALDDMIQNGDVETAASITHTLMRFHHKQNTLQASPIHKYLSIAKLYMASGQPEKAGNAAIIQYEDTPVGTTAHQNAADYLNELRNSHLAAKEFEKAEQLALRHAAAELGHEGGARDAYTYLLKCRDDHFAKGDFERAHFINAYLCERTQNPSSQRTETWQYMSLARQALLQKKNVHDSANLFSRQLRYAPSNLDHQTIYDTVFNDVSTVLASKSNTDDAIALAQKLSSIMQESLLAEQLRKTKQKIFNSFAEINIPNNAAWDFLSEKRDQAVKEENPSLAGAILKWQIEQCRFQDGYGSATDKNKRDALAAKGIIIGAIHLKQSYAAVENDNDLIFCVDDVDLAVAMARLQLDHSTNRNTNREEALKFMAKAADRYVELGFPKSTISIYQNSQDISLEPIVYRGGRGMKMARQYEDKGNMKAAIDAAKATVIYDGTKAAETYILSMTDHFLAEKDVEMAEDAVLTCQVLRRCENQSLFKQEVVEAKEQALVRLWLEKKGPKKAWEHAADITAEYNNSYLGYAQADLAQHLVIGVWNQYAHKGQASEMHHLYNWAMKHRRFQYGFVRNDLQERRQEIISVYLASGDEEGAVLEAMNQYQDSFNEKRLPAWRTLSALRDAADQRGDQNKALEIAEWQEKESYLWPQEQAEMKAYFANLEAQEKAQRQKQYSFDTLLGNFAENLASNSQRGGGFSPYPT